MADPLDSSAQYQNVQRIAVGGMGEVLLATFQGDAAMGISPGRVVLKRTLPRHPNRVHQNEMLLEEGRIGLRLLHANLVETFAVDTSGDDPLLLMEFLGGKSMAQLLGLSKKLKQPLPIDIALKIARDVACGLHFAHTLTEEGRGLGLVHRDVSPANIFATFDGRVKVIDFGVAKAKDSEIRTSTGILKGKIGYMSPEHAAGEKLSPSTDLWSIGVVLWEMLIADRLFAGTTPAVTLYQITHGNLDRPSSRRADLPAAVDDLVMRLLERDRKVRIASGADLVQAIDAVGTALGLDVVNGDVGTYLQTMFPVDSQRAEDDVKHAAKRLGTPAPAGLVGAGAATAATLVHDSAALMRLAREISADVARGAATTSTPTAGLTLVDSDHEISPQPESPGADFPTLAMPANFGLDSAPLRSDEDDVMTLVDDGRIRSLLELGDIKSDEAPATLLSVPRDDVDDAVSAAAANAAPAPAGAPRSNSSSAVPLPSIVPGVAAPIAPAATTSPSPAPQNVAPQNAAPQNAAPQNAAPQNAAPQNAAPQSAAPPKNPVATTPVPVPAPAAPPNASPAAALQPVPKPELDGPNPGPRTALPMQRSVGTVAVALASFGAIALVLGMVFSFVAHRRAAGRTPQVYVYPGEAGTDIVVARVTDAPEEKRAELGAVDLASPIARIVKDGPRQRRDAAAFRKFIADAGLLQRAQLPTGGRRTAAALPPAIVLLSLLALALAIPSFLTRHAILAWGLRFVLVVACAVVGYFGVTRGVLCWPGTHAFVDAEDPPRLDTAKFVDDTTAPAADASE